MITQEPQLKDVKRTGQLVGRIEKPVEKIRWN